MKKNITTTALVAAILLLTSFALSASNKASIAKNAKETVRREIVRNINCPDFIEQNDVTNQVKALVNVDQDGTVSVEEINSGNPRLITYVKEQLQNMKLKSVVGEPQRFVLVINFKVV